MGICTWTRPPDTTVLGARKSKLVVGTTNLSKRRQKLFKRNSKRPMISKGFDFILAKCFEKKKSHQNLCIILSSPDVVFCYSADS